MKENKEKVVLDSMENLSDEVLARLSQEGRETAFSLLFERYLEKILRYGKRFLRDEGVEDVVQDVFVKAYKNINSFNTKKRFSPWIYRIAHNELVNELKRRERSIVIPISMDVFLPYLDSSDDVETEIEIEDVKKMMNSSLKHLDEKYLEPLILYYFEELDYKEIGEVMHIPVSTVGVRIKRGKKKLRDIYEQAR